MDLVTDLRGWKKNTDVGEAEGKFTLKSNIVYEGMSSFSTELSIQRGVSEFECVFEHISFSEEGNFLCFSPFDVWTLTKTFQFYK